MNLTWGYVAVVYSTAVWLVRRGGNPLPKRIAAFFYLLVLAFLLRPLTGPYVNVATDIPQLLPPWSASSPPGLSKYTVSNFETQDVAMQLVPWAHQVRQSWRSLRVPLWNELTGCGFPLISNGQSAALSPIRLLALPLPLGYAMTAEAATKILIALTFTFLYCRRRGYAELPSAIAAACFAFGPFMIAWLHFAPSTVACFLPAVLYQVDLLLEKQTFARIVCAAVLGPLVLFSGHPETAAHILAFTIGYVLWIVTFERPQSSKGFVLALAVSAVISILLSLPFLVPFLQALPKSFRLDVQLSWSGQVPFSDFRSLVLLVQPRLYGTRPPAIPWGPSQAESITGFAGVLGIGAWFGLFADVIRRRQFRNREVFFIVATVLVFLTLANWQPVVSVVNVFLGVALNARLRLMFAFATVVMTAAVLDRASRGEILALAVALPASGAVLLYIVTRTQFPDAAAKHNSLMSMMPSLAVLLIGLAMLPARSRPAMTRVLATAVIVEVWLVTLNWNPVRPASTFYPTTPLVDAVTRASRAQQPYRAAGIGAVLFPNTNVMFGIEDVRVLDPMAPARYVRLLRAVMPDYNPRDYYAKWLDPETPLLDYLNVRWLMTEPRLQLTDGERYRLMYAGADGRLYENRHVLPRFFAVRNVILDFDPAGYASRLGNHRDWANTALLSALVVGSDRERNDLLSPRSPDAAEARSVVVAARPTEYLVEVEAPRHTLVVSSIGFWPGWRADANGVSLPVQLVNGAFLGFVVPPGHSTVRIRYLPLSFYASVTISLLTLLLLAVYWVRRAHPL